MSVKKYNTPGGKTGYRVRLDLAPDPVTGKRRQRMETFRTKKEADACDLEWRNQIAGREAVDKTKMTVRDLFDRWLAFKESDPTMSPKTLLGYRWIIEKRILPAIGHVPIQRLAVTQIDDLYHSLAKTPNVAWKVHLRLTNAMEYARKKKWLAVNPCHDADFTKHESKRTPYWTAEEGRRFLATTAAPETRRALRLEPGRYAGTSRKGNRETETLHPLWVLSVSTGMRPGELLGLRWRDIDWTAETITVTQQVIAGRGGTPLMRPTTKTREERDIVLPPRVVGVLRAHRSDQDTRRLAAATWEDNDLVFATGAGRPLTPKNVQRLLKALIALADVPDIPMYGQRHTHATLLIEAGRPINEVAQRMGHDPAVLMKTYAHVTQRMSRESARTIGHILLDA